MSDMGGLHDMGIQIAEVYRTAAYTPTPATGWFDHIYTDVLRDVGQLWQPSINKMLVKKTGLYIASFATYNGGTAVAITTGFNINGEYTAGQDGAQPQHNSIMRPVWLNEGDRIGAAGYKTATNAVTTDITRAFVLAGPITPAGDTGVTLVDRTAAYTLAATGWSELLYDRILRDNHNRFNRNTSRVLIKASGIYVLSMSGHALGVDLVTAFVINGNPYPLTSSSYNGSGAKVMWLNEGDVVAAGIFKNSSGSMNLNPFSVVGPLR